LDQRAGNSLNGSSLLLRDEDGGPVVVDNPGGASPILLLGDHAGRVIPDRLKNLGLSDADLDRHIAWDIGVAGVGGRLSRRIDATFIHQRFSRLVIDCNRAPGHPGSIAEVSDGTAVPGNTALSDIDRQARAAEIFAPYHAAIAAVLDAREAAGRRTLLLSLHSFTPSMGGFDRPWRFGVLHRGESAFSSAMLAALRARWGEAAGDNQPYAMDGTDFTIPHHADPRGLDYLELEVRQDTIETPERQAAVVAALVEVLEEVVARLDD
jgi:predicted N-formylglutamate amidohydrolase